MDIDRYAALNGICERLANMSCCNTMDEKAIRRFAALALDLDLAFMQSTGVFEGEEYDDNAAYDHISRGLARYEIDDCFVEDYMEAMEAYLNDSGAIAWDGE